MNEIIELKTEKLAGGGVGAAVARHNGKVVFVHGACPDEVVKAEITKSQKNFDEAEVTEIIEKSQFRVEPKCGVFGKCGGCQWQHVSYEKQLESKNDILRSNLERVAKIPGSGNKEEVKGHKTDIKIHAEKSSFGYRNKARFQVDEDKNIGFYGRGTNSVIEFDSCPILHKNINLVLANIKPIIKDIDVDIEELEIGWSELDELAAISISCANFISDKIVEKLLKTEFVSGVVLSFRNRRKTFGKTSLFMPDSGLGLKCEHKVDSFWQQNVKLNRVACETILSYVSPEYGLYKGRGNIIELFAGSGNLTRVLASVSSKVYAIESNKTACKSAINNSRIYKNPAEIVRDSAINGLKRLHKAGIKPEILVLDPPRTGFHKGMQHIIDLKPKAVIYMSCDSATFARDAKKLFEANYKLADLNLLDFFPQTFHFETLGLFVRET